MHPDGSPIAAGKLEAKVRIWDTRPILNESVELSGRSPKLLSTLSMHPDPVTPIQFSLSDVYFQVGGSPAGVKIPS